MENSTERKIPVYKLLHHKNELRQLLSFNERVDRCNFTVMTGWRGKHYVSEHGVDEYKPVLRGVDVLDVHSLKLSDYIILTDTQYKEYKIIAGLN